MTTPETADSRIVSRRRSPDSPGCEYRVPSWARPAAVLRVVPMSTIPPLPWPDARVLHNLKALLDAVQTLLGGFDLAWAVSPGRQFRIDLQGFLQIVLRLFQEVLLLRSIDKLLC